MSRSRLAELEASGLDPRSGELLVALVWLVLDEVPIPKPELKAALRRALLVLASGGDPQRELELDSVAAARLAEELDSAARRAALAEALAALDADGLPRVAEGIAALQADPELAWRTVGLALLADELAG